MRSFFDVSKVNESSFFKSNLADPQIFDAHLLEFIGFLNQDHNVSQMILKLIRTNEIEEKKFSRISDELAMMRDFLRNGCMRG